MSVPLSAFNHCYRVIGWRSVALFAQAYLTGRPREVRVEVDGIEEPVILRVGTTDVGTFKQIFIKKEYQWELPVTPRFIIDAGANIGLTTVFFANRYPDARIFSIEPEVNNFEMLCRNTANYPNVVPVNAALWNENTEINLIDPGLGEWGFQTSADSNENPLESNCGRVEAMTVDRIMEVFDIPRVDLLKMDIEGAEVEVLNDSSQWIDSVNVLLAELHERFQPGCEAAFSGATSAFDEHLERDPIVYAARAA